MKISRKISICGLVQGIGFRPFVHQVADRFHLDGEVCNDEKGVKILVTGKEQVIDDFYKELLQYPYQLARIRSFKIEPCALQKFNGFRIVPSPKGKMINLPFTPDMALCSTCSGELEDPEDKRFGYPFTACVECGQRWAIAADYPFEREHTSYRDQPMCASCLEEYQTLKDRRYHAQTISCPDCGFHCWLQREQEKLSFSGMEVFARAAEALGEGKIVAVKNSSGFLLCCDASNPEAINTLRQRKNRPHKPFAVLFPDLHRVKEEVQVTAEAEKELLGRVSPIVIMPVKKKLGDSPAFRALAPNLDQLGVMLPYNGILKLLSNAFNAPMVATSGNLHAMPVIADNSEALSALEGVADLFLLHNQAIINAQDDSVVKFTRRYGQRIVFRRSRGMAPNYFDAPYTTEQKFVAMGGELKSTLAVIPNSYLYISQYLGALGSLATLTRYEEVLGRFMTMFKLQPDLVIADAHPGYHSHLAGKKLAGNTGATFKTVQHHKAHFAAVLAEHHLFDQQHPVMGVIWDGTGYGEDGKIWGGEFFRYEDHRMERLGHFGDFPWMAGDKMAEQPRLSLLAMAEDRELLQTVSSKFSPEEWKVYRQLKEKTSLRTTSAGRIFDAVASLLGCCDYNTFEGQAAMQLEALADRGKEEEALPWEDLVAHAELEPSALLQTIYLEMKAGKTEADLALSFIKTLVKLIFNMASRNKITHLAFSGGVFQNALLADLILREAGTAYRVYFHKELSPNDENIAFGQLMYTLNCK